MSTRCVMRWLVCESVWEHKLCESSHWCVLRWLVWEQQEWHEWVSECAMWSLMWEWVCECERTSGITEWENIRDKELRMVIQHPMKCLEWEEWVWGRTLQILPLCVMVWEWECWYEYTEQERQCENTLSIHWIGTTLHHYSTSPITQLASLVSFARKLVNS